MQHPFMFEMFLLSGFLAGVALTYMIMRVVQQIGILDVPNERSSHKTPVPRGGGLAIVIAFIVFLYVNSMFGYTSVDDSVYKALVVGGAIIAAIGVLDDLNHIAAKWRFLTHLAAAVISLSFLHSFPQISALGYSLSSQGVVFIVLTLSLVWFVNLYNFMDGIDGIAGIEAVTALGGGLFIIASRGVYDWHLLFGFLGACVAGFLVWNWPPAKVFMGDACSGFLGFTLGFLAIATSTNGVMSIWSWLILFGVFVVDATTTLVTRVVRREQWFDAHRSHAYQILSRRYGSHHKVTVGVLVINVVWLIPLALLSVRFPYWAVAICCIALFPLLLLAIRVGAGKREVEA